MSEEEKKAIEQLRSWREYIIKHKEDVNKANDIEFYLRTVINLIEKQQKEIVRLQKLICSVRNLSSGVISYDEINGKKYLGPRKNFTKQELYKNHLKINLLLKGNYIFLDNEDFIKEVKGGDKKCMK